MNIFSYIYIKYILYINVSIHFFLIFYTQDVSDDEGGTPMDLITHYGSERGSSDTEPER